MLVTAGSLALGGKDYAAWSCLFLAPQEDTVSLQASTQGAEVLVLRYPREPTSALPNSEQTVDKQAS